MKLDAGRLAIALGGTTAIFWTICSALVAVFSGSMMTMTGHMVHMDVEAFSWTLTFPGFLMGLISWTVCAAVVGWLIAWIYSATDRSNRAS
jgi:hypothetical protein